MLRVGLTGGLGSGKSTAAQMFAAKGAWVISADEIGRALMQPGEAVQAAIVQHFGGEVVAGDGTLDRAALARLAFTDGRVEELNAIVHPAVIARQAEMVAEIAARDAEAVVIVESALLFETRYGGAAGWQTRFDRIVLVRATQALQIARFVARASQGKTPGDDDRTALEQEARRRLAQQRDDETRAAQSDYVLRNDGSLEELQGQVDSVWHALVAISRTMRSVHPAGKS